MKKTCLGIVVAFAFPALLAAQEPKFVRLKEEKGKVAALEVAITHYTNKSKTVTVDLVGVVHVGDRGSINDFPNTRLSCTSSLPRRERRCRPAARRPAVRRF